jgi:hypothetical protein
MKKIQRRRITVASVFFSEISTDQQGNRVVMRRGRRYSTHSPLTPLNSRLLDIYLKTT